MEIKIEFKYNGIDKGMEIEADTFEQAKLLFDRSIATIQLDALSNNDEDTYINFNEENAREHLLDMKTNRPERYGVMIASMKDAYSKK